MPDILWIFPSLYITSLEKDMRFRDGLAQYNPGTSSWAPGPGFGGTRMRSILNIVSSIQYPSPDTDNFHPFPDCFLTSILKPAGFYAIILYCQMRL